MLSARTEATRTARPPFPDGRKASLQSLVVLFVTLLCSASSAFAQAWTSNLSSLGPTGLALANVGGNTILYVAEYDGGKVIAYNLTSGSTTATIIPAPGGTFTNPNGIVVDSATGDLFVTDRAQNRVVRMGADGTVRWTYGTTGTASGQFQGPIGIARDSTGALYITEHDGMRVQKFTVGPTGLVPVLTGWPKNTGAITYAVAVDSSDNVYIGDRSGTIHKYNSAGAALSAGDISASGRFTTGLFMGSGNTLFASETLGAGSNVIQRFAAGSTTANLNFGADGAGDGQFNTAFGITVNGTTAYVADFANNRVQVWNLTASSGGGDTTAPKVNVSVASAGNTSSAAVFTVQFDESVTGATATSFTVTPTGLTPGTVTVSPSAATSTTSYTVTVPFTGTSGSIQLAMAAAANTQIKDASNNFFAGTASSGGSLTATRTVTSAPPGDTTAPKIVTFALANPTTTTGTWHVVFDEDVTGVDNADFVVLGGNGATVSGFNVVPVDARTYDVNFTYSASGQGFLQGAIKTSGTGIADLAGNGFVGGGIAASDAAGTNVDLTMPTVASFTAGTMGATSGNLTLTFSEAVTGVGATDFLAPAGVTVGTPTGSGTTYTVPLTYSGTSPISITVIGGATTAIRGGTSTYYFAGGSTNSTVQFTPAGGGGGTTPTIAASQTATTGTVNSAYSYQVVATNATSFTTTSALPAGLALSSTGLISGTPTAATPSGGTTIAVVAHNGSNTATGNVVITINAASSGTTPTIAASQTATTGTVNSAYSYQVVASNATSFTTTSALPAGLALSSTGLISGTPTAATPSGGTTIAVVAHNGSNTATGNVVITINAASSGTTPTIAASQTATTGTVNSAYSYQVVASNATSFTTTSTLPAGLTLSSSGLISGTPTAATPSGGTTISVVAHNGTNTATGNVVITINAANTPTAPTIAATQTAPTASVGTAYSYQVVASGATSFSTTSTLPAGLSLSSSGLISGTPTAATASSGTTIVVAATNAAGSVSGNVVLNVSVVPVVTDATVSGTVGTAITPVTVHATNSPTSFSAPGLGTYGLSINNSGVVSGTPLYSAAGVTVAVTATNAAGASGHGTITLNLSYPSSGGGGSTPPPSGGGGGIFVPPPPSKQNQTIVFNTPTSSILVNTPITLAASSSAGLPITYSIITGDATISGNTLTIQSAGTVVVRASQSGNGSYNAASPVDVSFSASKRSQSINFALSNVPSSTQSIALNASADSGLPVTFAVVSGPATISGNTLTINGAAGTVVVQASQGGDATFNSATVTRSFSINPVASQVFFGKLGSDDFAASIDKSSSKGMLIAKLASSGKALVLKFNVQSDGSIHATTTPVGTTSDDASQPIAFSLEPRTAAAAGDITINGTLNNGVLSGVIEGTNTSFVANVQPGTGTTSAYTGLYTANIPGSSSGDTYIVVGPNGQAFAVAVTPSGVLSGSGSVTPSGAVNVTLSQDAAITANLASDGAMNGNMSINGVARSLAGLSDGTARTDRLINLSSRLRVTGGDASRAVIAGFVVSGDSPKKILVRAVGPGLSDFGITDPLSAPTLQLFDASGKVVATNSGWSNNTDVTLVGDSVGAFKLKNGSKDAAVVATLQPGPYTAMVTSSAGNGVVLVEVYDATTGTQITTQQLINISTRGYVDVGEGQLVAGFVITGNAPKRVLIRGVGPGLSQFGVPNVVADPVLKVYQNGVAAAVAQNDNWETAQAINSTQVAATATDITAADTAVGAFPLKAGSKDAAVVITLMPGNYSAVVSGANNSTGAGLVEVYEIPTP